MLGDCARMTGFADKQGGLGGLCWALVFGPYCRFLGLRASFFKVKGPVTWVPPVVLVPQSYNFKVKG